MKAILSIGEHGCDLSSIWEYSAALYGAGKWFMGRVVLFTEGDSLNQQ